MIRIALLILATTAAPAMASAQAVLSLQLATDGEASIIPATYSCADGEPFTVQYVNAGPNALALLPVEGTQRVFVNVVSGSGARYASGPYIWWSRGDTATLENELEDGSQVACVAVDEDAGG
jgi:membrane-bound inhibitor of C-type lysozyme